MHFTGPHKSHDAPHDSGRATGPPPRAARRGSAGRGLLALALVACVVAMLIVSLAPPCRAAEGTGQQASAASDAGPLYAGAGARARRALVVVIDRIGIDDLVDTGLPSIDRLTREGGTALMNVRIRSDLYGLGSYVVIGAGGRAFAGPDAGLAFESGEQLVQGANLEVSAGRVYTSRTGRRAPPGSVANLYIEEMKQLSDTPMATSTPGLLGQAARDAGLRVAVVGNADSSIPAVFTGAASQAQPVELARVSPPPTRSYPMDYTIHREISGIAMDSQGLAPRGDVSSDLVAYIPGKSLPTTDFDRLVVRTRDALASNELVVVDMGQTSRVDEQAPLYQERKLEQSRRDALARCDAALGRILQSVDLSRDLVVICTPTPTRKMIEDGELLTPVVAAGPGLQPGTLLTAPTTRRPGLVTNFDIAPTVLSFLGVSAPADMEGSVFESTGRPTSLPEIASRRSSVVYAYDARPAMVKLFAISGIVVLLLALIISLVRRELLEGHPFFWLVIVMALFSGPLVYMLAPLIPVRALYWSMPIAVVLELAAGSVALFFFVLLGRRISRDAEGAGREGNSSDSRSPAWAVPRALFALVSVTLVVVLVDPFIGAPMSALSPFGTSVVLGARYYGIGNLYMGVALGAALLVACLLPSLFPRALGTRLRLVVAAAAVLALTVAIIGFPRLGAEVGGLITGVVASLVVLMKLAGWKIGWRHVVAVAAVLVLCVVLLLLADVILPGPASHAGKEVSRIGGKGISDALAVITRKLEANYKLTFASIWRLFLLMGIISALVWRKTLRMFFEVDERYTGMGAMWLGLSIAMVIALVFNDSGIEAAGALMVFFILPALALWLGLRRPVGPEEVTEPVGQSQGI